MKNKQLLGFTSLFASAATFGSFGLWIRILSREMNVYQQIVFRNAFALIFSLGIILFIKKVDLRDINKVNKKSLFMFSTTIPIAVILFVFAAIYTKIAVVTFAFYAGTIISSWFFGITVFKEKVSNIDLTSLLFVFIGLFFLVYPFSLATINVGFILAFISGFVDSLGHVFRKDLASKIDKFILVLFTAIGGIVISGGMLLYAGSTMNYLSFSVNAWLIAAVFGFLLVAVNFLLLVGFQNFEISLGSIVLAAELFFASVFGYIFLKEVPTLMEALGGVFILLAIIIPNINTLVKLKRS